ARKPRRAPPPAQVLDGVRATPGLGARVAARPTVGVACTLGAGWGVAVAGGGGVEVAVGCGVGVGAGGEVGVGLGGDVGVRVGAVCAAGVAARGVLGGVALGVSALGGAGSVYSAGTQPSAPSGVRTGSHCRPSPLWAGPRRIRTVPSG